MRTFNTTGPCHPDFHYMLPPEARLPELDELMQERAYFVLHAPRQTGKTTAMLAFSRRLRARGEVAVYATLETAEGFAEVAHAEALWIAAITLAATDQLPVEERPPAAADGPAGQRLGAWLGDWCARLGRPLVLLLDEVDVLRGEALVNFLRQLRAGFHARFDGRFPASVALIGLRDLRDWLEAAGGGRGGRAGSPFNVKVASLTLRGFTPDEVRCLLAQHTGDTGQPFTAAATAQVIALSGGQPWLVNALAREAIRAVRDRVQPIDAPVIEAAAQALILSRATHLDALAVRLAEPRVAAIIQAILTGDAGSPIDTSTDDFEYVVDLGLVDRDTRAIANPMYREVIARQLTKALQDNLYLDTWRWARDGHLDMTGLIAAFRSWWRENADVAARTANAAYPEVLPHLAFMAFLQRVVNGGGRIEREYAAGRGRVDLLVRYGEERHVVELKRVPPGRSRARVVEEGTAQLAGYLRTLGVAEGWLVVFDQHPGLSWDDRAWEDVVTVDGRTVRRVGA